MVFVLATGLVNLALNQTKPTSGGGFFIMMVIWIKVFTLILLNLLVWIYEVLYVKSLSHLLLIILLVMLFLLMFALLFSEIPASPAGYPGFPEEHPVGRGNLWQPLQFSLFSGGNWSHGRSQRALHSTSLSIS